MVKDKKSYFFKGYIPNTVHESGEYKKNLKKCRHK